LDPLPRLLFVTGRLAEFALREVLKGLTEQGAFHAEVAILPISVAALMTPQWVARHLDVPEGIDRIILPGFCRGDLAPVQERAGAVPVELGPTDLRALPRAFGLGLDPDAGREGYGDHDIEILAEINHAPRLEMDRLVVEADRFIREGADWIDLGCDPAIAWADVGEAVKRVRDRGVKVSIDSFNPDEVSAAVRAGAELVLSVNSSNAGRALDWGVEVVAIPDNPGSLDGLDATLDVLSSAGVPFRIDPILEPIGFGFAASLGRYLAVRRRHPDAAMLMGVGNLTELTDADSAGINTLLLGFCQELRVRSVLTTAVINWARSSVRELDLARKLVYHAVTRKTLPKHLEPRLVTLRDPRAERFGPETLAELQRRIRDPNWRIFAEDGAIHALNNRCHLADPDPFLLFDAMDVTDPSHAFYLGYEMMKAKTALTLSKTYRQDQALDWGFLTEPEISHRDRKSRLRQRSRPDGPAQAGPRSADDDHGEATA
jgi:dihydropteroate synthase